MDQTIRRATFVTEEEFWGAARWDASGCLLWQGRKNQFGYGEVRYGKMKTAPQVAARLAFGLKPPNAIILHSCDVRACINPTHLRYGTTKENAQDRGIRGRWKGGRSQLLSPEQIERLILEHGANPSKPTIEALSEELKISIRTAYKYIQRFRSKSNGGGK